jgi:hypothetical protein
MTAVLRSRTSGPRRRLGSRCRFLKSRELAKRSCSRCKWAAIVDGFGWDADGISRVKTGKKIAKKGMSHSPQLIFCGLSC